MKSNLFANVGPSLGEADERKILREVSFASSLGSLADRIVISCLRLESRIDKRLEQRAADEAIELLKHLAIATAEPVHVTGQGEDIGALSFLTSHASPMGSEIADTEFEDKAEIVSWLNSIVEALQAAEDGVATDNQLKLVLNTFTRVAELTLTAATDSLRRDHSEAKWKIAIPPS